MQDSQRPSHPLHHFLHLHADRAVHGTLQRHLRDGGNTDDYRQGQMGQSLIHLFLRWLFPGSCSLGSVTVLMCLVFVPHRFVRANLFPVTAPVVSVVNGVLFTNCLQK